MARKAATEWTVVTQRLPRRALIRLVSCLAAGFVFTVVTWLAFATEPAVLASGETNPAARVPTFVAIVAVVALLLTATPALRPPKLAANHYGVAIRPGSFRTLLLPWVHIEEVTAMTVPGRQQGDAYMVIAVDDYCGRLGGDRPQFLDRAVLREANRATEGRVGNYDLALRLADFTASPEEVIDQIAGFAPEHVDVVNQLDPEEESGDGDGDR
jgi:hypothetical protein